MQNSLELQKKSTKYQNNLTSTYQKETLSYGEELKRVRALPLNLAQFNEISDDHYGTINATSYSTLLSRLMSTVDRDKLKPSSTVAIHRYSSAIIGVIPASINSEINAASNSMKFSEAISVEEMETRKQRGEIFELGGYEAEQREIYEAMELPLISPQLYTKLGIDPPKGVLLYGPPGTGKTLAARAVAARSKLPFIKVVASEFVQKYLGEGPRMVRDVFRLAKERAPCVVFIDEIDAIGTKRTDSQLGADKEVQRILMELLTQLDGFDVHGNVKVMMATNRVDTLDPALLRPGRLDRKIKFDYPDAKTKRRIFQVYTRSMSLDDDVDIGALSKRKVKMTGADIRAICKEAGIRAVRDNRYKVKQKDFEEGFGEVTKNIALRTEEVRHEFYK